MTTKKKEGKKLAERKQFILEREKWNIEINSVASTKDEL
jgi:hypothetical protein